MATTISKGNTYLSKTLFMKGLQCHKALYLEKNHPGLKGEQDTDRQLRLAGGLEAGDYAKGLFPGGVEVPYDGLSHDEQVAMTQQLIAEGTDTIYEASFFHDGIFVKLDILHKGAKGWEMFEVKAANEYKDHYLNDISLQYYVTAGSGLKISKAHIVYMNREYVRKGAIDPKKLFMTENITVDVKKNQAVIKTKLDEIRKMLPGAMPIMDIGRHCDNPYECNFKEHCREHLPSPSVFDLCGSNEIKWTLYYEGHHDMAKLPLERLEKKQRFQVESFIGKTEIVDKTVVQQYLNSLTYPLCFFDFETFQQPVPPFDGTKPYQKIPFQYSLHVIEEKGVKLKHYEYLADPGKDPREDIAKGLISQIPIDATVLVYHKPFETEILNNLKGWFPKYAKQLDAIIDNIVDLKEPFSQRVAYHWKMQGSASLKAVLPAFIPEMTYEGMEVSNGGEAQEAYFIMQGMEDPKELKQLRKALIEYCKQDTLAMVRLLEKLEDISKASGK